MVSQRMESMIRLFKNDGTGVCVLLKQVKEYLLIASPSKNKFIVATYLLDDGSWSWGQYFTELDDAIAYFNERVGG